LVLSSGGKTIWEAHLSDLAADWGRTFREVVE